MKKEDRSYECVVWMRERDRLNEELLRICPVFVGGRRKIGKRLESPYEYCLRGRKRQDELIDSLFYVEQKIKDLK